MITKPSPEAGGTSFRRISQGLEAWPNWSMKWNLLLYPLKPQHSQGGLCQGSWVAWHSATGSPSRISAHGQTRIKAKTRRTRPIKTFQTSWLNHSRLYRGSQSLHPYQMAPQPHSQARQTRRSPSLPVELPLLIFRTPSTKTLCARKPQASTLQPSPCVVTPIPTLSRKLNWER